MKRILIWGGGLLVLLLVGGGIWAFSRHEPRPAATPGPEAEAFARAMMDAVDIEAWKRTGAVSFRFGGRHQLLWDRQRGFARVGWGDHEVDLDVGSKRGIARVAGEEVPEAQAAELLQKAYAFFVNDTFWLNPIDKLYDPGVSRGMTTVDGERGLLVSYATGGVTPGDAYLWLKGEDGTPRAWRMWVSVIPIGGARASWEGWTTLSTGAKVATRHATGTVTLELEHVEGTATLAQLVGRDDPFQPLTALLGHSPAR